MYSTGRIYHHLHILPNLFSPIPLPYLASPILSQCHHFLSPCSILSHTVITHFPTRHILPHLILVLSHIMSQLPHLISLLPDFTLHTFLNLAYHMHRCHISSHTCYRSPLTHALANLAAHSYPTLFHPCPIFPVSHLISSFSHLPYLSHQPLSNCSPHAISPCYKSYQLPHHSSPWFAT